VDEIRDFTNRRNIPGTVGNDFDNILRRYDDIEKIPASLFGVVLFVLAVLPTYPHVAYTIGLFAFMALDWVLLLLLPRYQVSFGPAKPPALLLAVLRVPFAFLPLPLAILCQVIGTLLVIYAFWIEPRRLTVTRQRLETPKLMPGASLRLLHLGDLHIERITQRELELNRLVRQLNPDIILFSGDILNLSYNEDPLAIEHARRIIQEWQAPLGVFFVTGSEAVDLEHVYPGLVKDLPVRWLNNETVRVHKDATEFSVTGLFCSHRPFRDAPLLETLAPRDPGLFSIFLYHSPDLAPNAAQMGFDLQLSGHTHGGQVCLPFIGPLFTGSLYGRRFRSGRYTMGPMTLYITRGIGLEGKAAPRVRFLCPPEIILWEITNPSAA
jgi:predicted MPP superfamily phosphohydrolase